MKNFLEKSYNINISKDKPVSLIHFITNRCNARCPHCFIDFDDEKSQADSMTLENIEKLAKSAGKQLMNVNLTGGEPFLDPDIEKVCEIYLKNTSIDSLFFSTNGAMVTKITKIAKNLSSQYPHVVLTFSISIDHIGDKHSDYRRVKNLYENAIKTYHELSKLGDNVQPNITITVCKANSEDIEEIFETLYFKENVKSITANIVRNEGVFSIDNDSYPSILKAYNRLVELITKNGAQYSASNFLARMMNKKEEIMYRYISETFLEPQYKLPCHAGGGLMGVIYPNGDVYPCEVLGKKMGNLHDYDMNVLNLWKDNAKLRSWIKDTKCHCTYECAWSYNILASPKHVSTLALSALKK